MTKSYEPESFETEIYRFWEESGCFEASDTSAPGQGSFCIVIPPPNVTGALHMGHALSYSIQDILVRWRRMRGDNALWLPGTDHAGIATQAQVEKAVAKEGKGPSGRPLTRHDLGRDAFIARTWKWKEEHGSKITQQLRRLGASVDWSRERFTMDPGLSVAVREVFVRLYEEGLIYRGERIINWCPRCQTALSDLEVIPTERKSFLWHLIYKIVNEDGSPVLDLSGNPAELVIATTRPETLLGDTAVAVHPEDERYRNFQGKKAVLPLLGRKIPVIADAYVDREFGSGVLKVTPAHDFNDYELGKRHGLELISVMGKDGRIASEGGPYAGLKFSEARERVLADLKAHGLLARTEDHLHKISLCQRCDHAAEPMVSKQWFVKIEPLAKPAIEVVRNGRITFTPKSWEKTYFEWMLNIRDWCVSRQLWWGHQIPAWYCGVCQGTTVATKDPQHCGDCGAPAGELRRDEDVLDTWFSSALWPFSTLGWPEKTAALKTFYPTTIMETGFDIIFFWVARMIMMGMHFMGEVPFRKVYLHAMVRDEKGEKMSKSKGNVIDPLEVIDRHGADPLRFTLAAMAGQGRDIKLSVDRVEGYRAFCNKIWNATKFFHLQMEPSQGGSIAAPEEGVKRWLISHHGELSVRNRWILSILQKTIETVEYGFESFQLNESAQAIYEFAWHEFCDWFIEFSKLNLKGEGGGRCQTLYTLHYVLEQLILLAHPLIPFVTEELWQSLPWKEIRGRKALTVMLQGFPVPVSELRDPGAEKVVASLKAIVQALRNFRGENQISPRVEFAVTYFTKSREAEVLLRDHENDIRGLAKISSLTAGDEPLQPGFAVIPLSQPPLEFRVSLKGLVNQEEEAKRLRKEIEKVSSDIDFVQKKLSQDSFVARAPAALVEKEKKRAQELTAKREELKAALERLAVRSEETGSG